MGMIKKGYIDLPVTNPLGEADVDSSFRPPTKESGADAAIERLSQPERVIGTSPNLYAPYGKQANKPAYKARDYDAEALGKVKFGAITTAYKSNILAGLVRDTDTAEQIFDRCKVHADMMVKYSFEK